MNARFHCAVLVLFAFTAGASAAELHVPRQFATIQAAIAAATNGDVVTVGPGIHREAIDLMGRRITVRSAFGAAETILEGALLDRSIITADGGESPATVLQGFTFRGGKGTRRAACQSNAVRGGAIFVLNAGLTVLDSVFVDNGHTDPWGGEIAGGGAIYACVSDVTIANSRFERNAADFGGAVKFDGAGTRDLKIERSQFIGNDSGFGGAISTTLLGNAAMIVSDVAFHENTSGHGGAIHANLFGATVLRVTRGDFMNNSATHGGALNVSQNSSSRSVIEDSDFRGNAASFGGGANIAAGGDSTADVTGCDFIANDSSFGGGLMAVARGFIPDDPGGTIRVTSSRFFDNEVRPLPDTGTFTSSCFNDGTAPHGNGLFFGGGVDARTIYGGKVMLTNCVFAGNSAARGASVHATSCAGGSIDLTNSTIVDGAGDGVHIRFNRTTDAGAPHAGAIRVTNSIVRNHTGRAVVVDQEESRATLAVSFSNLEGGFSGEGNIDAAPVFVNGSQRDYRLAEGSPGIDAGNNSLVGNVVITDVAGQPRFADDPRTRNTGAGAGPIVDMGAYELPATDSRRRAVR
jgi:predicted outer membrane repeat protein